LDDDPFWVRYKKAIIAGAISLILFIILLIAVSGGKDSGGDTPKPDPFEPVVDPFVLTP